MEEYYITNYEKKTSGDILSNNHYLENEMIKKTSFVNDNDRIIKNECKNSNKK